MRERLKTVEEYRALAADIRARAAATIELGARARSARSRSAPEGGFENRAKLRTDPSAARLMPKALKSPEEYRERALKLRTQATAYSGESCATMLEIATQYEVLAESVAAIDERSNKRLNPPKP